MNTIFSRIKIAALLFMCGLLQSCDNQSSQLSIKQNQDGIQASISAPSHLVKARISPERLGVAITLDDSDPVFLERQGENWMGNFPLQPDTSTKLGVNWFSGNVQVATMTRQIEISENNTSETFFPTDYLYLDSDSDKVMNIDELAANSDPFDETVWPDTSTVADNNTNTGLLGATGIREWIDIPETIVEVDENAAAVSFTLYRSGTATLPITIRYRPESRTASNATDYDSSTGLLEWPAGSFDGQSFEIALQQDIHIEKDEYFVVNLTNEDDPDNTNVFGERNVVIAIIKNNGGTYEVEENDTSSIEGWYDASTDKYGVNVNARVEISPSGNYNVYRIVGDCYELSSHSIEKLQNAYIFEPALFVVDGGYYRASTIDGEMKFSRLSDHNYDGTYDMTWPRIGELGDQILVDGEPCTE